MQGTGRTVRLATDLKRRSSPLTEGLVEPLLNGKILSVQDLSPAAFAFLTWRLARETTRRVVVITEGTKALETVYQNLYTLGGEDSKERLLYYPGWEALPGTGRTASRELAGDRLQTLQRLLEPVDEKAGEQVVASSVQALLQRTVSPELLRKQRTRLEPGETVDPDVLAKELEGMGYDFTFEVVVKGEAVRRGGVLDVWPPDRDYPLRLEFFGDELESIRTFDPSDQRSVERLDEVVLCPARDEFSEGMADKLSESLLAFAGEETLLFWYEPDRVEEMGRNYELSLRESGSAEFIFPMDEIRLRAEAHGQLRVGPVGGRKPKNLGVGPCDGLPHLGAGQTHSPDALEVKRNDFLDRVVEEVRGPWRVQLWFHSEGSRDRFASAYLEGREGSDLLEQRIGQLTEGFRVAGEQLLVIAESDLYGVRKNVRGKYDPHNRNRAGARQGTRFDDWTDLIPGELVVHVDNGIGRYLGLVEIVAAGRKQEVLSVEYAEGAKLHLPLSQAHLLSRYVGLGKRNPRLHKLGGKRWTREVNAVADAVEDLATHLLETQAARQTLPGHAYAPDGTWQKEFEATFPFQETVDQETAIEEVKADMESHLPMDRLICGDVGFGKTEVAMRAAFKTVMDGKQVAMLVPTTILAHQHYQGFVERMVSFPVAIEMLSGFRSKAQQTEIMKKLRRGEIDIVIGTHRLLSKDVGFADLGLVVIDEEQRFGVRHKEKLKQMRQLVDILTLSATPIPRTLYMSLTGARDMSVIQTPPRQRQPVETIVEAYDEGIIRKSIQREIARGGQVFFLHNRVRTIEMLAEKLRELIPEARIVVGHGQMGEGQLEKVMTDFIAHKYDVLLSTTIIESGLDIPNANTILIDRADRFGLSDLYQLRGRVGRYKNKAYCYLLLPRSGRLVGEAYHRIKALQRHASLGSGFKLAMRDLEIRGAGSLLGASQSGHITNVGFDLYCQLLERTVKQMKNEPLPPVVEVTVLIDFVDASPSQMARGAAAVIPYSYVEDDATRIQIYRKLAGVTQLDQIPPLQAELKDRFGAVPPPVVALLKIAAIKAEAIRNRIEEVSVVEQQVRLRRGDTWYQPRKRFPRLQKTNAHDKLDEVLAWVQAWDPRAKAKIPAEKLAKLRPYEGVVVEGHRVASGEAEASPYPAGTIRMQTPRFRERGLDLSGYHPATINVSLAPKKYVLRRPDFTFEKVRWSMQIEPETFHFSYCLINGVEALVYYPDPATKPDHPQPPTVVEVLAPFIEGLAYGDSVVLELP